MSKKKTDVVVVECPSAFPPGWRERSSAGGNGSKFDKSRSNKPKGKHGRELDFQQISKEVRELGSTTFTGYDKKVFHERKYEEVTGLKKKREKIPIKILRGKKAKYAAKINKIEAEAKEAGIILATKKKEKRNFSLEKRKAERSAGPAPSIGFMMKGTYRVRDTKR